MTATADPDLLSFTQKLLEKRGALAEERDGLVFSLLPGDLAQRLEVREEAIIGGEEAPLLYGSPLLDRLILLATREFPVLYGEVKVSYLKKAGFEEAIERALSFPDAKFRLSGRGEGRANYMVLTCHFAALSDERKEGIIRLGVQESNGAHLPDFAERLSAFPVEYFEPGPVPAHFPRGIDQAVSRALESAQPLVKRESAEFLESMNRRLRRDAANTSEYFRELRQEMIRSLKNSHLGPAQREERKAKIRDLPREMAGKIEDLKHKYRVKAEVSACAAVRLLVPVVWLSLEVFCRKYRLAVQTAWNPVTQQVDPLVCESCGQTMRTAFGVEKDSRISLRCRYCRE
jgi:hypothetical protein